MSTTFTKHSGVFSAALVLLTAFTMRAQITFTDQGTMLQNIGTVSYADCAADMNSDGLDDVVRVVASGIYIDYQQPNGSFTPAFFPMSVVNLPSWSICAGDIDGNGYLDLLFGAGNAVSFVYANDNGTGYTEDAHPEYIFTQRSTFADIDNDGNLDAFCNHDVDQCHPYRNVDGAMVLDHTLIPTLDVGGNYAAIWVDYDNDWDTDLYITKCRGGAAWGDAQRINLLYKNNGDGTFTESGAEANMNDGNQSWTTTFEDFDNDGDFDAFTVNHSSGDVPGGAANKFMRNNGDGTFTDVIGTTGINAADLGAWNCDAGDFDNNGFVDIFSEMSTEMYWNNGDGSFTGSQLSGFNSGGIGDFNNDGFLDVISGNSLWINDGNANNYIKFDLQGIASNKDGIGARIEIYGSWGVQIREVRSSESFDPGSSLIAHFGLGAAAEITQAIIKWPSGVITTIDNPEINQTYLVPEAGCTGSAATITANGPLQICPGQTVTLEASAGESYLWSDGSTNASNTVSNGGNYSVLIWDANGCVSASNFIAVEVIDQETPELSLVGDETFCAGSSAILTSTIAQSYAWSNGQTGQNIVVTESGDYYVSVEGACSGVFIQSEPISITVLPTSTPVATDVQIGVPGTATLNASGTNLEWYATESSTEVLGTGNTFTTDFFDNTISYWVQGSITYGGEVMTGGKADNSGTGGLPATGGKLIFDVTEPFTLQEVTVYVPADGVTGSRTIELYDAGNTLLQSMVVDCNVIGMNTVTLNMDIPVGTGYQIGCAENNLFRNSMTLPYPFAIGDAGQITGSSFGSGYYYYFYNWVIKKEERVCVSERVQVNAAVVDVNELTNPLGISLYPNPANAVLSVTSGQALNNAQVRITDATGRTVISRQLNLAGKMNQVIDVNQLAAGLYHLTVISGDQQSKMEFIKE